MAAEVRQAHHAPAGVGRAAGHDRHGVECAHALTALITGMSHAEISAALDDGEGTVRVRVHRALARLGRIMYGGDQ